MPQNGKKAIEYYKRNLILISILFLRVSSLRKLIAQQDSCKLNQKKLMRTLSLFITPGSMSALLLSRGY